MQTTKRRASRLTTSTSRVDHQHHRQHPFRIIVVLSVIAASLVGSGRDGVATVLSGQVGSQLQREPQLTPGVLGNGGLDGLQFADPAASVDLVDPPASNSQGTAELEHPLWIPPGRGNVQPDLTLRYSSSGGSTWAGTGWDLDVGSVEVDTRWGVPRFETARESETYLLDGATLSPTAVRSTWTDRIPERDDFTRRTETSFEHIVRHGTNPKNFWWEVTDKMGAKRWYGGLPDCGGPDGDDPGATPANPATVEPGANRRDPGAILSDSSGNGFRWALSAQRDVGGNFIRYKYDIVTNAPVGAAKDGIGSSLYLKEIYYTGWAGGQPDCKPKADDAKEDFAYKVVLTRDGGITPRPTQRADVMVDGRGGFLNVTADLLRRVEVFHGTYNGAANPISRASRTAWTTLARRYDLNYAEGAFGKSLLVSVDQKGSDGQTYATNRFDYYDEVRNADGSYNGFGPSTPWTPGDDQQQQTLLGPVETSVLGASSTVAGDVRAYIGFNPGIASKTGSFGGAFSIGFGTTDALAEFLDINGDGLPDKIFREGGQVKFRLNTSGPSGATTFGEKLAVVNLNKLSHQSSIGIAGGFEAFIGVAGIQLSIGGDVAIGDAYFTDANDDGLPDFVADGNVLFNHLERVNTQLIPTFTNNSAKTKVPIDPGTAVLPTIQNIADLEAQQRAQSPLFDTIRRWEAPFNGTIAITGDVTLTPPPSTTAYASDGVRIAIQRAGDQLWTSTLTAPGQVTSPNGVDAVNVSRGQVVYFRLGSIDAGLRDHVVWNPTVTYTSFSTNLPLDVNGLNQTTYVAANEFTLAGRPGSKIIMPLDGTIRIQSQLTKLGATSDDVRVEVLKNGTVVSATPIAWNQSGSSDASIDLPVVGGTTTTTGDTIEVRLRTDSPIDIHQIVWNPQLYYLAATKDGAPIPTVDAQNKPTIVLRIAPDLSIYPINSLVAPSTPWTSDLGRAVTTRAVVSVLPGSRGAGSATVTVKQRNRLVAKTTAAIPPSAASVTIDLPTTLVSGEGYWFDVTLHDDPCALANPATCPALLSTRPSTVATSLRYDDGQARSKDVPSVLHRQGVQGIFPLAYRNWSTAGYRAEAARGAQPIVEADFTIQTSGFETREPTGFNDPEYHNVADSKSEAYVPYILDLVDAEGNVTSSVPVWRGSKDNMVVASNFMRSSRRGADDPAAVAAMAVVGSGTGGGTTAVRRVGITAPQFAIAGDIAGFSGSFAAGPSFGLLDYTDMNGDSFPDIVAPGYIQYTGPRGAYRESGAGVTVVSRDSTFAVGAGFGGGLQDIRADSFGKTNNPQPVQHGSGNSAAGGDTASPERDGFSIGAAANISAQFSNPVTSDPAWNSATSQIPGDTGAVHEALADVNGDGLPDKVSAGGGGVRVQLNLGYKFLPAILWSTGGFESGRQFSGTVGPTLGFNFNKKEFAAGLSYTESVDMADYTWSDIDGDGSPDRLRRTESGVMVAFGTGIGVLPEVKYGNVASPTIAIAGGQIPTGQQIAQGRDRGLGGGFDFTISIGPLCIAACYLIINPGVHVGRSISTSQVQMLDVNGDGYPDSLISDADRDLRVFENKRGKTNLLRRVRSAIGGEISIGYGRAGNQVDQPYPHWVMSSVQVDDKRPGDGVDTMLTTYEYGGDRGSRLEKEVFGFSTTIDRQREDKNDANVFDDPVVRSIRRTHTNRTVFDAGLVTLEELLDPSGVVQTATATSWRFANPRTGAAVNVGPEATDPADLRLLSISAAPEPTQVEQRWFSGGALAKSTINTFEYDTVGNVIRQLDSGELGNNADDVLATTHFTSCAFRTLDATGGTATVFGTGGPIPPGAVAYTFVSVPEILEVFDASGTLMRRRDALQPNRDAVDVGRPCENQSLTRLDEAISSTATAITELDYDDWGNYVYDNYPANATGQRYKVDYVYDPDSHRSIADTTDSHGVRSTAEFDPLNGLVTERVDANGQRTSYRYDAFGRLASITGPYEQGSGHTSVMFTYSSFTPSPATGYGFAVARHHDAFNAGNTIDTVTFIDGIGRVVQTKQDATVFAAAGQAAQDVMQVSGAVEFDPIGRPVREWYPTTAPLAAAATFTSSRSPVAATVTDFDVRDRTTRVAAPGGRNTTTAYGFSSPADLGATLFTATTTDPEGRIERRYVDVRDSVLALDDYPDNPALKRRTRFNIDGLGQLRTVTDVAGNITTHTYDLLGRRTSTTTPDAGRVEYRWDNASNLTAKIDANLRAKGQQIVYSYDFGRLTSVRYPTPDTPNATYTYGGLERAGDANGNGAGRVIAVSDGSRDQTLTYERLGSVSMETSTMLVHNLDPLVAPIEQRMTFKTSFVYDGLGRLGTMTYPDGERLSYGYDSGGLLKSISGTKGATAYGYLDRLEYDEFFDRRFQQTANAAQTEYSYDPATRWVARQATNTAARPVQDINYTYDLAGNVKKSDNTVPIPTPDLKGGPVTQTYDYDPYYRLRSATGAYRYPPATRRNYTFTNSYDVNGNILRKEQTDIITSPGGKGITQKPTTYTDTPTYVPGKPHQIAKIGGQTYSCDANGNFTGWVADRGGQTRTATYDAADRVRSIADQGATTRYTYDHARRRAIERGPSGETAFVNDFYTVRNATQLWKHIWAGDDRLVTQKVHSDGTFENWRYFMHKDLQGSTNIVTDHTGLVFQHLEYFPSGEIWVHEKSDVHREPYLFGGAYFDEVRQMLDMGERWYEPRQQFFYSPDPVLTDNPGAVLDDTALVSAYTFADSNPLTYGDFDGRAPSQVRARLAAGLRRFGTAFAHLGETEKGSRLAHSKVGTRLETLSTSARWKRWAKLNQDFQAKPLVEYDFERDSDGGLRLRSINASLFFTPNVALWKRKQLGDAGNPAAGTGPVFGPQVSPIAGGTPRMKANRFDATGQPVRKRRPPIPSFNNPPPPRSGP